VQSPRNGISADRRVRRTAGDANDGEALCAKMVRQLQDVLGPIQQCTARLRIGAAHPGSVARDQTDSRLGSAFRGEYGFQARTRKPVKVEGRMPPRITILSIREPTAITQSDKLRWIDFSVPWIVMDCVFFDSSTFGHSRLQLPVSRR